MSLYEEAKQTMAQEEISNWQSDLYLKVTDTSKELVKKHKATKTISTFTSQIDGTPWYEILFAYDPFWERRMMGKKGD